ncbi:hypothetical protein Nepgr_024894 [Nepenthes gracilis]|uniref:Uncharacterized protein n=1 Tax=Nepenthes gracilis TaxID=150966 RepID=A0AAD3T5Q3_NEPGR|nr:hypothetical protein Nepgr_024894 [Nepenthes gracilis]
MHNPVFATQKQAAKSDKEWTQEHKQVCGYIWQFVDDNVYNHIRYKDGSSVADHLNEFQDCVDRLSGMGIKFEDERS